MIRLSTHLNCVAVTNPALTYTRGGLESSVEHTVAISSVLFATTPKMTGVLPSIVKTGPPDMPGLHVMSKNQ